MTAKLSDLQKEINNLKLDLKNNVNLDEQFAAEFNRMVGDVQKIKSEAMKKRDEAQDYIDRVTQLEQDLHKFYRAARWFKIKCITYGVVVGLGVAWIYGYLPVEYLKSLF
jgi:chromosome segregation ATPase